MFCLFQMFRFTNCHLSDFSFQDCPCSEFPVQNCHSPDSFCSELSFSRLFLFQFVLFQTCPVHTCPFQFFPFMTCSFRNCHSELCFFHMFSLQNIFVSVVPFAELCFFIFVLFGIVLFQIRGGSLSVMDILFAKFRLHWLRWLRCLRCLLCRRLLCLRGLH